MLNSFKNLNKKLPYNIFYQRIICPPPKLISKLLLEMSEVFKRQNLLQTQSGSKVISAPPSPSRLMTENLLRSGSKETVSLLIS